jgi:hypothetical protein
VAQSEAVVSWLHAVVLRSSQAVPQAQLVECFAAWIRLGALHEAGLAQQPAADLGALILSGLSSDDPGAA